MNEIILISGLAVNTIGLGVVLFKLVWGSATSNITQFAALDKACSDSIAAATASLLQKLDNQSANVGNVVQNIGNRIHDIELKAAEMRALAAETYMRRDSYHKATDEFKRDVREENDKLRADMQAGFNRLETQVDNMSASFARGILGLAATPG